MTEKFTAGAFCFYQNRVGVAMLPEDVRQLCIDAGFDPAMVPDYKGDRTAVSRARSAANREIKRLSYTLDHISQSKTFVEYSIMLVERHPERAKAEHTQVALCTWNADRPEGFYGDIDHVVAQEINKQYRQLRGKLVPSDWTDAITKQLVNACHGMPMRDDGRIYWIPPQSIAETKRFGELLSKVGINLVLCEIEAQDRQATTDTATSNLYEQLTDLEEEAKLFNGKQKPSLYKNRLDTYEDLRKRATLYRDALGVGIDKAQAVLDRLESEVGQMLTLRHQFTVPRGQGAMDKPTAHDVIKSTLNLGGDTIPQLKTTVYDMRQNTVTQETYQPAQSALF